MTIKEIKNLPNGTTLLFDGDDTTIFTKVEDGISCSRSGEVHIMPFHVAELVLKHWSIAK